MLNGQTRSQNSEKPGLSTLKEHFRKLNAQPEDEFDVGMSSLYHSPNPILDQNFTEKEIKRAIRHFKNNRSCGIDEILNEYLNNLTTNYIKLYTKLFNVILKSGIIPEELNIGIIKPLYILQIYPR